MAIRKKTKLGPRATSQRVPKAFQNHLERLFGSESRYSKSEYKSPSEWRKLLKALLVELDRYRQANVRADQLHEMLLREALRSTEEALKSQDFWPGYAERLARFALLLMGDYPDHHRRKGGKRRNDHY